MSATGNYDKVSGTKPSSFWSFLPPTASCSIPLPQHFKLISHFRTFNENDQTWLVGVTNLGLGELSLNLPVLCYASNSWKCNYYTSEEAVLCLHYAQLGNGIYL